MDAGVIVVLCFRHFNLPEELLKKVKLLSGIYTESRYGILSDDIPAKKFKEKDVIIVTWNNSLQKNC